ncbi:hypothetical protein D9757_001709 [Collybiopsis confluens]|uniref:Uncharacterized protein n=1 Tax=Collybiopsis confluens TaxID=2823264 RepID=A0A8H5HYW2_9AGAR|nr:hypothetical protein D9757_001709 [Collybiopsis confluens]
MAAMTSVIHTLMMRVEKKELSNCMASTDQPPSQRPAPAAPAASASLPAYFPTQPAAGPSTLANQYAARWTMAAYPYASSQNITPYPQQQYLYAHTKNSSAANPLNNKASTLTESSVRTKAPTPEPPPAESCKNWDHALKTFLQSVGLTRALRGLELDLLVLNSHWENHKVPSALQDLANNIQKIKQGQLDDRPLEERKLDHIHLSPIAELKTPATLTKSVSAFLAQKRANNEASNRAEFLRSLEDQRARNTDADSSVSPSSDAPSSSCARTDAKIVDRNVQIKYDIAKNDDGPLRRTMRNRSSTSEPAPATTSAPVSVAKGKAKVSVNQKDEKQGKITVINDTSSDRHSGLDERMKNIEEHSGVRYVPYAPLDLLDRLRFLEEHIIRLEKDYPPWAAIHFNQPHRNWPPPPKQTPIIVPPNLNRQLPKPDITSAPLATLNFKGKNSSLHRAVMERLEVHNAKLDLQGGR